MRRGELKADERAAIALRALYQTYGYSPYKVGRFEEYDLYVQNRNFLPSERILTFTDTDGKLMALKPDVTLSIVKNTREEDGPLKVSYAEHIYRPANGGGGFREIMQTGVECLGEVDAYAMGEVLMLAARSLETISEQYALDVSDMGVVSGVLAGEDLTDAQRGELLAAISAKSAHDLRAACERLGVSARAGELLDALVGAYGPLCDVLPGVEALGLPQECEGALFNLRAVAAMMRAYGLQDRINLDFSVVNDMGYYNGLIMSGFVDGVPSSVLSGGRYDPLLRRLGRSGQGIGFAVYLDQIERLTGRGMGYDVDVLITCDEQTDPLLLARTAEGLVKGGQSVRVQRGEPGALIYRRRIHLEGEGAKG